MVKWNINYLVSLLHKRLIGKEKLALEPWWRHWNAHKARRSAQHVLSLASGLKRAFDNTACSAMSLLENSKRELMFIHFIDIYPEGTFPWTWWPSSHISKGLGSPICFRLDLQLGTLSKAHPLASQILQRLQWYLSCSLPQLLGDSLMTIYRLVMLLHKGSWLQSFLGDLSLLSQRTLMDFSILKATSHQPTFKASSGVINTFLI